MVWTSNSGECGKLKGPWCAPAASSAPPIVLSSTPRSAGELGEGESGEGMGSDCGPFDRAVLVARHVQRDETRRIEVTFRDCDDDPRCKHVC